MPFNLGSIFGGGGGGILPGVISLLAGGLFGGGGGGGQPATRTNPLLEELIVPEVKDLLALQKRQLQQSDPVRQAVLRMAFSLLPGYSRQNLLGL